MSETETLPDTIKIPTLPADAASGASKAKAYALTFVVNDQDSYELVAQEVRGFKARWRFLESTRVAFTDPLNKHVKRLNDWFRGPLTDLEEAADIGEQRLIAYRSEKLKREVEERRRAAAEAEKQRLELERRAREAKAAAEDEERRKRQDETRLRLEKEEAERQAAKARERELDAKRRGNAEAEAKAKADREALERFRKEQEVAERKAREEAEKARSEGEERERKALDAAMAIHAMPPVVEAPPKATGAATRRRWKAEVTSKLELIKGIAEGIVPASMVNVNVGDLNRAAQAADGELRYPGVRTYPEDSMAFRTKV